MEILTCIQRKQAMIGNFTKIISFKVTDNKITIFIKQQKKKRTKYLFLGPGLQKIFSVIESYTTWIHFNVLYGKNLCKKDK